MNQILVDNVEYIQNLNASRLRKNLKAIKYAIIILIIQCIILSSMLGYRVYSANQNSMKNDEDFMVADNTVINERIILDDVTNTEIEINKSNLINIDSGLKIKLEESTVEHNTSNGEKYTIIGKLNIPSLNINMNVLSSTSKALLNVSINKYWGPNPNEVGNLCIVGHNYENGTHFSNLEKIKIGDIIKLTDSSGKTLTYTAYETGVIEPTDTACTSQLTNGNIEITLITCYNSGKQRFYVKARA